MKTDPKTSSKGKSLRQVGIAMTIPMALLAGPLVGWFIGDFLEKRFQLSPYVTLFFTLFGFVAGVYHAWKLVKEISQNDK